ncbi:nitrogen regulation protein NR(I) [Elongatibacter sediminis]|uniref:DNA-binding transcriptional regulator NtrC n=1 Tax=Elongatibacter sediminis TaxID=3119006 RepID=A0AAW9RKW3_9GAMM
MSQGAVIWVVDDDETIRFVLQRALRRGGYQVECFEDVASVRRALEHARPAVMLTDIRLPDEDGLGLIDTLQAAGADIPVVAMTAYSDLDQTVSAYQKGVFDYLPKPFDLDQVISVVERAVAPAPVGTMPTDVSRKRTAGGHQLIGESAAMQEVFRTIGRLYRSDINVLITGETGTGKEVVARVLHEHSPRARHPFIALNTAAIPSELLESELFGHERGAFTGAHARREGRFEEAAGGTLFLDEIGDMPLGLQTRLLRVLAEGEYYRVGGRDLLSANARVIAATHQDLEAKVADGSFREDLYHRLNVIHVALPPLRDRREDIGLLARRFLHEAAEELGLEEKQLRPDTGRALARYDWPGNVRQLQNVCRQLSVMAPAEQIFPQDLPPEIHDLPPTGEAGDRWADALRNWARAELHAGAGNLVGRAQAEMERVLIDCALERTGGQRIKAAELLGLGRNTLTRKLKQHDAGDNGVQDSART